uniref:Uncharacterized protein n=1 Tax=Solanum lycopersicum TaxID=4081 RepID=A0A3Q7ECX5_SOLLC
MEVNQNWKRKKKGLVTTNVKENTFVDFVIVPSTGVENLYTIKLIKNNVGTMEETQNLTRKKRGLVTTKVIENTFVDFVIVPSTGVENLYTIKLKKNEDEATDPYGLNCKYNDMLHGWRAERRQRQNGKCETFYFHERKHTMCRSTGDVRRHIFHGIENLKVEVQQETNAVIKSIVGVGEKKSKKRERDSSISEGQSATKKHTGTSETKNFLNDAWNNLMSWDDIHKK